MIQTIRNAWKVPELRNKLLFTIFALLIFRVGTGTAAPTRKMSRANTVNISLLRSSGTFQALRIV